MEPSPATVSCNPVPLERSPGDTWPQVLGVNEPSFQGRTRACLPRGCQPANHPALYSESTGQVPTGCWWL